MTTSDRSKSRHRGTRREASSKRTDRSRHGHGLRGPSNLTDCFFDHLEGEKVAKASFIKSMERHKESDFNDLRRPSAILNVSLDVGLLAKIDDYQPDDSIPRGGQTNLTNSFFDHLDGKKSGKDSLGKFMEQHEMENADALPQPSILNNFQKDGYAPLVKAADMTKCFLEQREGQKGTSDLCTAVSIEAPDMTDCFFDHLQGRTVTRKSFITSMKNDSQQPPRNPSKRRFRKQADTRTVESCYGNQHPTVAQLRIPSSCDESLRVIEVDF